MSLLHLLVIGSSDDEDDDEHHDHSQVDDIIESPDVVDEHLKGQKVQKCLAILCNYKIHTCMSFIQ